jgi:hypothetical protein
MADSCNVCFWYYRTYGTVLCCVRGTVRIQIYIHTSYLPHTVANIHLIHFDNQTQKVLILYTDPKDKILPGGEGR